jgi:hypothetical protein
METGLNLPAYQPRIRERSDGSREIFDPVRKKFIALTPEEWVRQHMLNYLIIHKNYPAILIGVEVPLRYNNLKKRSDIVVFNTAGRPAMIIECKAPDIPVTQVVFEQAAMYNIVFHCLYLLVTNGITHYICIMNYTERSWKFVEQIPDYSSLTPEICT